MTDVGWENPDVGGGLGGAPGEDFESVYAEHYTQVLGLAYVMSGRVDVAEEATQDAFIKLLAAMAAGEVHNPPGWVRTAAVNLARSRLRRARTEFRAVLRLSRRRVEPLELDTTVESEEFWEHVRSLPPRQAEAVALHYLEDRSVRDVASLMDIAEGTAKALLHQGRAGLRRRLSTDEDVDGGDPR
ncbi:RNA polymerase sigma factor [Euzebya tangerina]|uniref:RNA polymerase sigma factor n=1 Tax=Euzebya tangerina TaxID=591198 RepID=UPI0013C31CA2|nr:RNA polymerase sigma factor [Euzebya tangerina]